MKIRDAWNAQADKYNQFDILDEDEIEQFADEIIERLSAQLAALKKDARVVATWEGSEDEINSAIQRILEATKEVE